MRVTMSCSPAYTVAYVRLTVGESVFAERGAMVAMSAGMEVSATMQGGVMRAAFRRAVADESLVFARYTAQVHEAWVALAPKFPGDAVEVPIGPGQELNVQSGSLLAYSDGVDVTGKVGSFQSVVLKEGAVMLRASGSGSVIVCAYGGLERFDVAAGQSMIVDTGHLAAWSASMGFRVGPLSDVVTSSLTGEGLVGQLTGPGTVFVQTRAEQQLSSWLLPDRDQNE